MSEQAAATTKPEPRETVVHGSASGFAQEITVGGHALRADEPTAMGGTDTGLAPYDLLLSALGACTSMTMSMYARRKQWPLESVTVRLRHSKIHAADCAECETKEGRLDRIERDVELQEISPTSSGSGSSRLRTNARCTRRSPRRLTSGHGWCERRGHLVCWCP